MVRPKKKNNQKDKMFAVLCRKITSATFIPFQEMSVKIPFLCIAQPIKIFYFFKVHKRKVKMVLSSLLTKRSKINNFNFEYKLENIRRLALKNLNYKNLKDGRTADNKHLNKI